MRSYHVAGSTVNEVIPIVNANVAKEAAVMTDSAQLYKYRLGDFASHDRVDHSKDEYVRYEEGRPVIHTNTVEGYFSLFKRGMRGTYQHCKEKHLHRVSGRVRFPLQQPLGAGRRGRGARKENGRWRQGQAADLPTPLIAPDAKPKSTMRRRFDRA